jgi:hypothetical protein
MTLYWGAWKTGSTNRGMRLGIDVTFSAVTHTSTSCTATMKFYTQNVNTWDAQDKQMLEFDGNYSLPETHEFYNQGDEAGAEYRTTRTYTWGYPSGSYNVVPTVLDIRADLLNMYNGADPFIELHINFPVRPFGAPAVPTTCAVARTSDTSTKVTWVNKPTTGEPYTGVWLERYIYNYATWARIATLGATVATYQDTGAVANRKYSYRVQADNSVATSGYAQSGIIYTAPAAPTAPVRTDAAAGAQTLTWALAVGYTEYETEVWRAVAGTYALLATVASGATTYTDTTASAAQKTKYKFRTKTTANATVLYSADSAETTETTGIPTAPAAPTTLKPATGTIDPTGVITHTWVHVPTDGSLQTFFEVQYRHVGDASWQTSGKIASATSSWVMPRDSVSKGNQVEWQVRTWGYSSTLAGAWSASAFWMTTPLIPLKYPMFLDVDTGQVEANSTIKLITEQHRKVGTVTRTTATAYLTTPYNICTFTLPAALARTGKRFRISGECNIAPDTIGMYTDLQIRIGVGATGVAPTAGTQIGGAYIDHRAVSREVSSWVVCEYTFDPATAGGENISTINIVLVGSPVSGGSKVQQAANRPAYLIIDEIIDGSSTAAGGPAASSATTITAGEGLVGGGDLSASRVLSVAPGDSTLIVEADSVRVDTNVMATRAYADAHGGPGGPSPVSGVWGTVPLDAVTYGPDSLRGDPIYLDSAGLLRSQPQLIAGVRNIADSPAMYPVGVSVMGLGATDAAALGWPSSCTVVTTRRAATESVVGQFFYQNHTPQSSPPTVMYRSGNGANNPMWSAWAAVGPNVLASTKTAAELPDTYPLGFSTIAMTATENAAGGWPGGSMWATVQTIKSGLTTAGWATQVWSRFTSDPKLQEVLYRSGNVQSGWMPWQTMMGPDTGWTDVTFDTDWINYGEPAYRRVQYRRIGTEVSIRGLAKSNVARTTASPILTLPVGFRPAYSEIFQGVGNLNLVTGAASTGTAHTHTANYSTPMRIDVLSTGVVQCSGTAGLSLPAAGYLSLSGISFTTD